MPLITKSNLGSILKKIDYNKDYLRVKLNPNLTFEGLLLDKLNFKKCSICYKDGEPQLINEPPVPTYSNYSNDNYKRSFEDVPFPTINDYREYRRY